MSDNVGSGNLISITNRSKIGFGYTTACEQTEQGLRVCDVSRPDFTGTIKQVIEKINSNNDWQSVVSGNTYYATGWFVKNKGRWIKISVKSEYTPYDLLFNYFLDGRITVTAISTFR